MDDKLRLEAWLGWHHQDRRYKPTEPIGQVPLIYYNYERDLTELQADARRTRFRGYGGLYGPGIKRRYGPQVITDPG